RCGEHAPRAAGAGARPGAAGHRARAPLGRRRRPADVAPITSRHPPAFSRDAPVRSHVVADGGVWMAQVLDFERYRRDRALKSWLLELTEDLGQFDLPTPED